MNAHQRREAVAAMLTAAWWGFVALLVCVACSIAGCAQVELLAGDAGAELVTTDGPVSSPDGVADSASLTGADGVLGAVHAGSTDAGPDAGRADRTDEPEAPTVPPGCVPGGLYSGPEGLTPCP